jgi:hypothetical protein
VIWKCSRCSFFRTMYSKDMARKIENKEKR